MRHLTILALAIVFSILQSGCSSTYRSGSGYLIGTVDTKYVGEPIFTSLTRDGETVTYLDRNSGIIFVSSKKYEVRNIKEVISRGSGYLPNKKKYQYLYLEEVFNLVECKGSESCADIDLCERRVRIVSNDPSSLYYDFQARGFPIAQLTYTGIGKSVYDLSVYYFKDCEFIGEDIELIVGSDRLLRNEI